MIEEAEILEHDAHAAAHQGQFAGRDAGHVAAEDGDEAPGRLQRQQDEPQQRRLAGSRRAGEELERMRLDAEAEVLENLRPHAVAQADILETHHCALLPLSPCSALLAGAWAASASCDPRDANFTLH